MHIRMKKFMPGENTLMVLIASFIGAGAGLVSILFRIVLELVHKIIFVNGYSYVQQGGWHILLLPLVPMCGMILLIPLSLMFPGEINGYGLPKFLRKVNMEGGYIPFRTIILKILSCSLTIGTGNSAGVEGPIALVGGALGSQCGKFSRVSGERMKIYIAAGSAGAIAAVFNAPIAGVFFAAEIVLLGTYEISSFSALVVSSAIATVVSRAYYGESPVFQIPPYHLVSSFTELPLYMLMGLFMGVLAVLHIRFFYKTRDFFATGISIRRPSPLSGLFSWALSPYFSPELWGMAMIISRWCWLVTPYCGSWRCLFSKDCRHLYYPGSRGLRRSFCPGAVHRRGGGRGLRRGGSSSFSFAYRGGRCLCRGGSRGLSGRLHPFTAHCYLPAL